MATTTATATTNTSEVNTTSATAPTASVVVKKKPHQSKHHSLLLAMDVGSSSTRCSVFSYADNKISSFHNIICYRKVRSIHPTSGRFNVGALLEAVDDCIDETLERVQRLFSPCDTSDSSPV